MNTNQKKKLLSVIPSPPEGMNGWPWTEETDPDIYDGIVAIPKITIVTPSFNQGRYIEQTIRSVLLQNYPNLEYIIIDGGSHDDTVEIIRKYEPWLKYWVSEGDNGQSHAINKGMSRSNGEIFNWLNSDDYYYKSCFRYLAENFTSEEIHIVAGNYRFFDTTNKRKEKIIDLKLRNSLEETIAFVLINQPSTFFRLKVLKSLGEINENLSFVMDQDIWKKYLFRYGQDKIKVLNKDLTNFRFHATSKTYQCQFNNEYSEIFCSMAKQAGLEKQTELLRKIYGNEKENGYKFEFDINQKNIKLVKRVINNLIFYSARSAFTNKDLPLLNDCLSILETKWLNQYQRDYTLTLRVKSKLIKYKLNPVLKLLSSKA